MNLTSSNNINLYKYKKIFIDLIEIYKKDTNKILKAKACE